MKTLRNLEGLSATVGGYRDDPEMVEMMKRLAEKQVGTVHISVYKPQPDAFAFSVNWDDLVKELPSEKLTLATIGVVRTLITSAAICLGMVPAHLASIMAANLTAESLMEAQQKGDGSHEDA